MGMIAVCDGCGEQVPAGNYHGKWFKPSPWYQRTPDGEKSILACSRRCIKRVEDKRKEEGKDSTEVVTPF